MKEILIMSAPISGPALCIALLAIIGQIFNLKTIKDAFKF